MTDRADGVRVEMSVPFHDVDALRVVWHGHYFKYLEIARTELFRAHRLDVDDIVALGFRFVMAEASCRHVFPLRYGERFSVRAWFGDIDHRILVCYEITNVAHARRAARARTALVTTDANGAMLLQTPDAIRARIR